MRVSTALLTETPVRSLFPPSICLRVVPPVARRSCRQWGQPTV